MKIIYNGPRVILNLYTRQMPEGTSYELELPAGTQTVAIDRFGLIHAYSEHSKNVWPQCTEWNTNGTWEEIADLELEIDDWEEHCYRVYDANTGEFIPTTIEIIKGI